MKEEEELKSNMEGRKKETMRKTVMLKVLENKVMCANFTEV